MYQDLTKTIENKVVGFLKEIVKVFPVLLILFVGTLFGATNLRTFEVQLSGRAEYADFTVTIAKADWVLISDKEGKLYDPLDEKNAGAAMRQTARLPLSNGNYLFEIIHQTEKVNKEFAISNGSPAVIVLDVSGFKSQKRTGEKRLDAISISGVERKPELGRSVLTADDARLMPGSGGDVVRTVANMPGVVKTSTFASGMFVRGGEIEDTLFTYDAIRIGNPFHHVGFYSTFPPASIESLNFYPGTSPTKFASQGSVIEILSKTRYNKERLKLDLDVNLAAAGFYLSIPLSSFIQISLSARRTYYEFYFGILKEIETLKTIGGGILGTFDAGTIPFFYDLSVKVDWNIDSKNTLSAVFIASQDQMIFNAENFKVSNTSGQSNKGGKLSFQNDWNVGGLVFSHDEKRFQNKLTLSRYYDSNGFTAFENALGLPTIQSSIENFSIVDAGYAKFSDFFALEFGSEYTYQTFPYQTNTYVVDQRQGFIENLQNLNNGTTYLQGKPQRHFAGLSASTEWTLGSFFLNAGARGNWNSASGLVDVDPRGGVTFEGKKDFNIYLKGGKYSQLPPLIQSAQDFGTPGLKSPFTVQGLLGGQWKLSVFDFKSEIYYGRFFNQIETSTKAGAIYDNSVEGQSYGAEIYIKKNPSKEGFLAWFGYSFNRSERTYFRPSLNQYVWGNFRREVNHSLNLTLAQVIIPKRLTVGLNSTFSTGRPYTPQYVTKEAATGNLIFEEQEERYTERTPPRFTVNFRIEWSTPIFKTGELSVYLDLWNIEWLFGWRNVVIYTFDAGLVNPGNPRYDSKLKVGDRAPATAVNDLLTMPILGVKLVY